MWVAPSIKNNKTHNTLYVLRLNDAHRISSKLVWYLEILYYFISNVSSTLSFLKSRFETSCLTNSRSNCNISNDTFAVSTKRAQQREAKRVAAKYTNILYSLQFTNRQYMHMMRWTAKVLECIIIEKFLPSLEHQNIS